MKRSSVGGQAVLEGVMMKTPLGGTALAVRRSDGSIVKEFYHGSTLAKKGTFFGWPIVRGVVSFIESLVGGMKITTRSAEIYGDEEVEEPTKFEKWLSEKLGKSVMDVALVIAVILAIALSFGLFYFLPTLVTQLIPWGENVPTIFKSLVEGVVRLLIFLAYLFAIGFMKDIGRLYMYHGAEHKVISCYENEGELEPENIKKYSRLHARCGTNYLFLVMAVSIVIYAILPYSNKFWLRLLTRLIFLPLVAGVSYEVLRAAASSDGKLACAVRAPGLALQHLTTREPETEMIEVALAAFNLALDPPDEDIVIDLEKEKQEKAAAAKEETKEKVEA